MVATCFSLMVEMGIAVHYAMPYIFTFISVYGRLVTDEGRPWVRGGGRPCVQSVVVASVSVLSVVDFIFCVC